MARRRQHDAQRRHARPAAATASACCKRFDTLNRSIDSSGVMDGMDAFTQQALGILTSSKLVDALDLSKEDPKIAGPLRRGRPGVRARRRAAHGPELLHRPPAGRGRRPRGDPELQPLGLARPGRQELRRRAARTCRCSTGPSSALVADLHERGLDKDVSVVVWGEFGRTPQDQQGRRPRPLAAAVGRPAGRRRHEDGPGDRRHRPHAGNAVKRPVTHSRRSSRRSTPTSGLNLSEIRIFDPNGRPQYLVDPDAEPMRELI